MTEYVRKKSTFTFGFICTLGSKRQKNDSIVIYRSCNISLFYSKVSSQPTIWFISKIGSRIEITMNPTITAINRIIIGSIRAVIPVMRVSTSRS